MPGDADGATATGRQSWFGAKRYVKSMIAPVRVPFRSLDSVAADLPAGARVVMKIDVEGTEDAVFASGQRFLHDLRPDMLCVLAGVADPARLEALLARTATDITS